MKKIICIMLAGLLLFTTGCHSAPPVKKRYEAQFLEVFDTVTKVIGFADSKKQFTALAQDIYDKLYEYHRLYDIYNVYDGINNIKTINDNAGKAPVKVDRRIIDLLLFAKEEDKKTNGACNVALGAVLTIWHEYREAGIDNPEEAKLPPMEKLQEAAKHTDIDNVVINEAESTVFLSDPLMSLDVGAVAKGYATEMTAVYFASKGTKNMLLSVGGNVRAIGEKLLEDGNQTDWTVGIQSPDNEEDSLLFVKVNDSSVVTSGIYERYYTVEGKRYHHIIDPETLFPTTRFTAVSILCHDSGLADALSTAIFNMSLEDGKKYVATLPKTEAMWVMPDGSLEYSAHFKDFIKE